MSDGRVFSAYLLFVLVSAIIPWLIYQSLWTPVAGGGIAILWWIIAAIFGDKILLKTIDIKPFNAAKYPQVAKIAKHKRISPKISYPTLWMINDLSPMIISIGLTRAHSHLIFTTGFIEKIEDKAQKGLIFREVESIREGLTSANTALATLLWIILLPGRIGTLLAGKRPGEPNIASSLLNLIPAFVLGYPCAMIGFNRNSVHRIDTATLSQLDNPDYLPYALMKLQDGLLRAPFNIDLAFSGVCAVNPNSTDPFQVLFKLHPPTPKRIDRLRVKAKADRRKF
jgi:hypothetical protein